MVNKQEPRLSKNSLEVGIHLILLILYFASINVKWSEPWITKNLLPDSVPPHYALAFPIVYVLNAFWLIPKLLGRKKWLKYFMLALFLGCLAELLRALIFTIVTPSNPVFSAAFKGEVLGSDSFFFGRLAIFMANSVILSFGYRFSMDWIYNLGVIYNLNQDHLDLQSSNLVPSVATNNIPRSALSHFHLTKEPSPFKYSTTFHAKKGNGIYIVKVDDISYFKAQGDFILAVSNEGKKYIVNDTLKGIHSTLNPKLFYQINRSEIINKDYIREYRTYIKNRLEISLSDLKTTLYTSNSRTPGFRNWINSTV